MLISLVCFQLSAENIVGNVTVGDVTDEEVRCTEALLPRVLPSACKSHIFSDIDSRNNSEIQTQCLFFVFVFWVGGGGGGPFCVFILN